MLLAVATSACISHCKNQYAHCACAFAQQFVNASRSLQSPLTADLPGSLNALTSSSSNLNQSERGGFSKTTMSANSPSNEYERWVAAKKARNAVALQRCVNISRAIFSQPVTSDRPRPSQRKAVVKGAKPVRASLRLADKPCKNYVDLSPEVTQHGRATLARLKAELAMSAGAQQDLQAEVAQVPRADQLAATLGFSKAGHGWTHKVFGDEKTTEVVNWFVDEW